MYDIFTVPYSNYVTTTSTTGTITTNIYQPTYQYFDGAFHRVTDDLSNVFNNIILENKHVKTEEEEEVMFTRTKELDDFLDSFPII